MSRLFSFLRRGRSSSNLDNEKDLDSDTVCKTSPSGNDRNRLSLQNVEFLNEPKRCSSEGDFDSLLDNESFGNISVEIEDVDSNVKPSEPSMVVDIEEELKRRESMSEGEGFGDDDEKELLDDFVDEALHDLELEGVESYDNQDENENERLNINFEDKLNNSSFSESETSNISEDKTENIIQVSVRENHEIKNIGDQGGDIINPEPVAEDFALNSSLKTEIVVGEEPQDSNNSFHLPGHDSDLELSTCPSKSFTNIINEDQVIGSVLTNDAAIYSGNSNGVKINVSTSQDSMVNHGLDDSNLSSSFDDVIIQEIESGGVIISIKGNDSCADLKATDAQCEDMDNINLDEPEDMNDVLSVSVTNLPIQDEDIAEKMDSSHLNRSVSEVPIDSCLVNAKNVDLSKENENYNGDQQISIQMIRSIGTSESSKDQSVFCENSDLSIDNLRPETSFPDGKDIAVDGEENENVKVSLNEIVMLNPTENFSLNVKTNDCFDVGTSLPGELSKAVPIFISETLDHVSENEENLSPQSNISHASQKDFSFSSYDLHSPVESSETINPPSPQTPSHEKEHFTAQIIQEKTTCHPSPKELCNNKKLTTPSSHGELSRTDNQTKYQRSKSLIGPDIITSLRGNLPVEISGTNHVTDSEARPADQKFCKRISLTEEISFFKFVNADHAEAEARLAQRRAARAEARELRLREIERQQKEKGNDDDEDQPNTGPATGASMTPESTSRTPSIPRSRASLPSNSISRRSSEDSLPDDNLPSSSRELKAELKELQEKFRNSMISNAQLDNEKATLTYEVDFLKDKYSDLEEAHTQLTKDHRRKCSETEQLKKITTKLKEEVKVLRRVLQERDELIQEYGLVLVGEEENGDAFDESYDDYDDPDRMDETVIDLSPRNIAVRKALLSQEASELLKKGAAKGSLDVRLRKYAEDKNELEDEVQRIRLELEEVLNEKRKENGLDHEKQKEASKSINEYKFRIQKAEAEVSTLQANVARLDSLVSRYKASTEELEKSEEELKQEKRRLQRELRESQNRLEELEITASHLQKRFDKLKTARSALLKDLSLDPPC